MKREEVHHYIYLFILCWIAVAIPLSNFMLSMGGIFLSVNWALTWDWKEKWARLRNNRTAIFLALFFFLCMLCLAQTEHTKAGFLNIINKLPLLYAPIIMATSKPLKGYEQRLVVNGFLLGVLIGVVASVTFYLTHPIQDIREISVFISHIRFSMCIVLALCFCTFFVSRVHAYPWKLRALYIVLGLCFLTYLFLAQTLTGIFILFVLIVFLFFYLLIVHKEIKYRKWIVALSICFIVGFSSYFYWVTYSYFHPKDIDYTALDEKTAEGNPYSHNLHTVVENGSFIEIYICKEELADEWVKHSDTSYQDIEVTLIRYLNSKGLRKDREGVKSLNQKDIQYIECGIANVDYTRGFGIKRSLYPLFFSFSMYEKYHKIEHASLLQRLELWNVSWEIVASHFWFGVGLGDHKPVLDQQLVIQNSPLSNQQNMGCHNQFLTCWLIGGAILVIYLVFMLFYPLFATRQSRSLLYYSFFLIIFISLFTEDTLETQIGITLYAFFNSFLLFVFDAKKFGTDPVFTLKNRN